MSGFHVNWAHNVVASPDSLLATAMADPNTAVQPVCDTLLDWVQIQVLQV